MINSFEEFLNEEYSYPDADVINEAASSVRNVGEFKQWLTDNNFEFEEIKSGFSGGRGISVKAKNGGTNIIFDFVRNSDNSSEFIYKIAKDGKILWDEDSTRELDRLPHDLIDYCEPRVFINHVIGVRKNKVKKAERDYAKRAKANGGLAGDYDLQVAKRKLEKVQNIYTQV